MAKWIYDGCTKVHDSSRGHMIEQWCYKCSCCGHIVRTAPKRQEILFYTKCPNCNAITERNGENERNRLG